MMQIPLEAVASQTLQTVVGGQSVSLAIYTKVGYDFTDSTLSTPNTNLYMDVSYNGITLTTAQICLNEKRILINRQYLGFVGDFMFIDSQGDLDPVYTGLAGTDGGRYWLLYLEAADLAALAAA